MKEKPLKKAVIISALLGASVSVSAHAQSMRQDPFGDATVSRTDAEARAAEQFDKLDANHDGFLTADEMSAGRPDSRSGGDPARAGRRGEMMMRMADANGDGKVSKDEFVASLLKRFDRMDADHDGQLTKAERDAFRATMRQRWQGRDHDHDGPPPGFGGQGMQGGGGGFGGGDGMPPPESGDGD